MKHARSFPPAPAVWLLALVALFLLPACQTFDRRAREKAEVFSALDPATQERLRARELHVGDTTDMVYIALGRPSETLRQTTATGRSETWIYQTRWDEYQGTRFVGYRRHVTYDPLTKAQRITYVPEYRPVYAPRVEDRIRITFERDRVAVIEQVLDEDPSP